jgi:hypothetical protein
MKKTVEETRRLDDNRRLPHTVRKMKSRMIWVEHVARIGEKKNVCRISAGNLERDY